MAPLIDGGMNHTRRSLQGLKNRRRIVSVLLSCVAGVKGNDATASERCCTIARQRILEAQEEEEGEATRVIHLSTLVTMRDGPD